MANFYGNDADNLAIAGGLVNFYGGDGNDALFGDGNANELDGGQE
jgi:hypothetical protein